MRAADERASESPDPAKIGVRPGAKWKNISIMYNSLINCGPSGGGMAENRIKRIILSEYAPNGILRRIQTIQITCMKNCSSSSCRRSCSDATRLHIVIRSTLRSATRSSSTPLTENSICTERAATSGVFASASRTTSLPGRRAMSSTTAMPRHGEPTASGRPKCMNATAAITCFQCQLAA